MKNYKIKNGLLEVAYIWNEGSDGKKGYYGVRITKSYKDKDGTWKDSKIRLSSEDTVILSRMLSRLEQVGLPIQEFQMDKND